MTATASPQETSPANFDQWLHYLNKVSKQTYRYTFGYREAYRSYRETYRSEAHIVKHCSRASLSVIPGTPVRSPSQRQITALRLVNISRSCAYRKALETLLRFIGGSGPPRSSSGRFQERPVVGPVGSLVGWLVHSFIFCALFPSKSGLIYTNMP